MAGGCYGRRRLSELLQEQQEPFLLLLPLHGHGGGEAPCCSALGRAARRALRPGYGCFPCGRRDKFRRLPRGGDNGGPSDDDDELGGGDGARQQLSPVSVLDVLQYDSDSDEVPTSSSSPPLSSWEDDDDDEKGSTASGSSPPPAEQGEDLTPAKTPAREAMAALVELELSSGSTRRQWRRRQRLWEEDEEESEAEEASRVGESIEAMIFEEIRAEAVRDMIDFRL